MNKKEVQELKDILWANTWSNKEIIEEGIATLKQAFEYRQEGFRRIEASGLLAIYTLQQENQQLKEQLKQRDEIINEVIKFVEDYDFAHNNVLNFYNKVLNGLQKYKGDNNE
jgi:hypothetical protein